MRSASTDLDNRAPVWLALSELFLDTTVSDHYDAIARCCAHSPYSLNELAFILHYEVAPVLWRNLLSPAGHWSGFDEQWLISAVKAHVLSARTPLRRALLYLYSLCYRRYLHHHWQALVPRIKHWRQVQGNA
tara:strand:+ start:3497 stop:3892 length:396 start_codon:yes stop_codon:yes gene_type:complete